MEEITVMNGAEMEPGTEAAPVDAGQEISVAELLGAEQQQDPAQTVEQQEVDAPQQEEQPDQKEISKAFALERARLEAKFKREYEQRMQTDPAYTFGRNMLSYIAQSRGLSMEDAAKFAEAQRIQAIAQSEGVSPNVARMLYERQQTQQTQQTQQEQGVDIQARAQQIKEELAQMELPEGFDFNEAVKDEAFAQMLLEWPAAAAVRVYHAERQAKAAPGEVAERLRARAAIPQAMKPQQPVTPEIDFESMPTEQFWQIEEKIKSALAKGQKIKF